MEFSITFLVFLASLISCVQGNLKFNAPPNVENVTADSYGLNPKYDIGSVISARWESNDTKMFNFYLIWLDPVTDGLSQVIETNYTSKSYNWTASLEGLNNVSIAIPKSDMYVIAFAITDPEGEEVAYAHAFNVTAPKDKGLSTGAVAGIAVGTTIGGLLLLGGLGYLAWKSSGTIREFIAWRKSKKAEANEEEKGTTSPQSQAGVIEEGQGFQSQSPTPAGPKFEVEGQHTQSPELPSPSVMSGSSPRRHESVRSPEGLYEAP